MGYHLLGIYQPYHLISGHVRVFFQPVVKKERKKSYLSWLQLLILQIPLCEQCVIILSNH